MNTVLFLNATIGFSENLFLVMVVIIDIVFTVDVSCADIETVNITNPGKISLKQSVDWEVS